VMVLSDAELRAILRGRALLDGGAAVELTKRGFADSIGVEARDWGDLPRASFEVWDGGRVNRAVAAVDLREHRPEARELSELRHRSWVLAADDVRIAPGTLLFENAEGGRILTVAFRLPTPLVFDLGQSYAYNETRKRRLAELLALLCEGDAGAWSGGACHAGDAPLLFRTGRAADGARLWLALPISLDSVEEIPLVLTGPAPTRIERLAPDATWIPVPFEATPGGLSLRLSLRPLEPALLRLDGGARESAE